LSERKKARKKERKENKNKNYFLDSGILLLLQKLLYKIGKSFSFFFCIFANFGEISKDCVRFFKKNSKFIHFFFIL
jgi:hypothetical protein